MAAGGAAQELHAMAVKLGIVGVVNLLDVAAQLGQITHRAEPNVQQQQQTGLMPGHLTHLTTDPVRGRVRVRVRVRVRNRVRVLGSGLGLGLG